MALLANAKDTGFVGVNLYCDDEAGIMGAQANLRASDIANCCGKPLQVGGAELARSRLQFPACCIWRHRFLCHAGCLMWGLACQCDILPARCLLMVGSGTAFAAGAAMQPAVWRCLQEQNP